MRLAGNLESSFVPAGALVRVAPHDQLVRVIGMFGNVDDGVSDNIDRITRFITVRASQFPKVSEVGAQFVLEFPRYMRIECAAIFAYTAANLRVSPRVRLGTYTLSFDHLLPRCRCLDRHHHDGGGFRSL